MFSKHSAPDGAWFVFYSVYYKHPRSYGAFIFYVEPALETFSRVAFDVILDASDRASPEEALLRGAGFLSIKACGKE